MKARAQQDFNATMPYLLYLLTSTVSNKIRPENVQTMKRGGKANKQTSNPAEPWRGMREDTYLDKQPMEPSL